MRTVLPGNTDIQRKIDAGLTGRPFIPSEFEVEYADATIVLADRSLNVRSNERG
jgi:hypothetical protein